MIKKLSLITLACIGGFIGFIAYAIWTPEDVKEGSIIYYLKTHTELKTLEKYSPNGAIIYNYSPQVGARISVASAEYESLLSMVEIIAVLKKEGTVTCQEFEGGDVVCRHGVEPFPMRNTFISVVSGKTLIYDELSGM